MIIVFGLLVVIFIFFSVRQILDFDIQWLVFGSNSTFVI